MKGRACVKVESWLRVYGTLPCLVYIFYSKDLNACVKEWNRMYLKVETTKSEN